MTQDRRQVILENLIYLIIWMILFAAPVFGFRYHNDASVEWNEVFRSWKMLVPFFILFIVNNYILIPCLLLRKKRLWYLLSALLLTGLVYLINPFPLRYNGQHKERLESLDQSEQRGRFPFQRQESGQESGGTEPDSPAFGTSEPKPLSRQDVPAYSSDSPPPPEHMKHPGADAPPYGMRRNPAFHDPFFFFMSPLFKFLMMVILVIGINIAVKLMFRLMYEERRVKDMEKQTLQNELEYLKHQINPHFFMNTLNNIHALIDIDAEKAKETVLDLSKMMRYVLYDTEQAKLPLEKEIRFLTNYVDLMKLRYTDQVEINIRFPEDIPDVQVPPLLFISFLENAFKHGVSYRHQSFIDFSIRITDGMLECKIENNKFENKNMQQDSGIGLDNVKKRLRLLYNDNYRLSIRDEEERFNVLLIIPV